MSARCLRPGLSPGYAAIITAAAIAITALTALTACTSTPGDAASAVAAASVGPGGRAPTLTGSGSTFDAPFFSVAFAKYQQQHRQ